MPNIFEKQFEFRGKHAKYVTELTKDQIEGKKSKLFPTNVEVFLLAAVLGATYKRAALKDDSKEIPTSIFVEQFTLRKSEIDFIYKLVMLTDKDNKLKSEERIDLAFRHSYDLEKRDALDERFMQVMLGGIELLYERIIENNNDLDSRIRELFSFLDEFRLEFESAFATQQQKLSI